MTNLPESEKKKKARTLSPERAPGNGGSLREAKRSNNGTP